MVRKKNKKSRTWKTFVCKVNVATVVGPFTLTSDRILGSSSNSC